MLQSIRTLAHSWVVKTLMLLLIVSFSIWGIGDIFRGNPLQKTVAKVGDRTLTVADLTHDFSLSLARARQAISPTLTAVQAKELGLLDKSLENLVERALIEQEVTRQGISITPQTILQMLAEDPHFRTKDGAFNKELFARILQQKNMSESAFLAEEAKDAQEKLLLAAVAGLSSVPPIAVEALYKGRAQTRILDVVTIEAAKLNGSPKPDEKALRDFYEAHPELFSAPETRGVTIATLSTETLQKDITISEAQLKKAYDEDGGKLSHPEQRDLLQVVLHDEVKAKQLAAEAHHTGDLAAAAKEAKEFAIPLEKTESTSLMPDLAKPVFALPEKAISDPIKTQLGWHVVQVKKIIPAGKPTFESIKEKLRTDMQRDQAIEAATKLVNQLDDALAAGRSLEDVAQELRLSLRKIASIDAKGLTPEDKQTDSWPNKEALLKDAFLQNAGETSPVEDDKEGTYSAVRTDQVMPSGPKPFEQVKSQVAASWLARQQGEKAKTISDSIAKDLHAGKSIDSFAKMEGVSVRESAPLSPIGDTDAPLPTELLDQAFKMNKGETAVAVKGSAVMVARLARVTDADTTHPDPRKNKLTSEIRKNNTQELLSQYLAYLRSVFPVTINAGQVDQIRMQGEP